MDAILRHPVKRVSFHIMREKAALEAIMPSLPEDEVYKILSTGGFSSIAFVRVVADVAGIDSLFASTLAVGKKHLAVLDALKQQGKLDKAHFVVGGIMKQGKQEAGYGYFQLLENVCERNGWTLTVKNNHSKVLLFDTPRGKYVLETSSNLNENPKMEQFSFEKSEALFDFYKAVFGEWMEESE